MSNLTQDNNLKRPDTAKKTIEQPTDVEDADDRGIYDDPSDFDHINNSPDIKLRSIEVDEDITGRRHKNNAAAADSDGKSEADDNSGTGHRVTSNKKSPSLASSEVLKLRLEKNKAVELIKNMRHSFLKFKQKQEEVRSRAEGAEKRLLTSESKDSLDGGRAHSEVSNRSVNSIRSQRYVKLKKVSMNTI